MAIRNPNLNEDVLAYDKLQTAEINRVGNETVGNKALVFTTMGPAATGWQNSVKVPLDVNTVGNSPVVLSIMYESSNGLWILVDRSDFQILIYTLQHQLEIQLLNAARVNVKVRVTILPSSAIKSGGG